MADAVQDLLHARKAVRLTKAQEGALSDMETLLTTCVADQMQKSSSQDRDISGQSKKFAVLKEKAEPD